MPPQPYPHRVSFLAPAMHVPAAAAHLGLLYAKVLAAAVFDHLLRHSVVSVADFDDERLSDLDDQLLDARHPEIEETIDWYFRVARRHEVLWLDVGLEPQRLQPVRLRSRRPTGPIEEWTAPAAVDLGAQIGQCLAQWLEARRLAPIPALPSFALTDLHVAVAQLDRVLIQQRGLTAPLGPDALTPPPRLAVPYLRALADLASITAADAAKVDDRILTLVPDHLVALRNQYLTRIRQGTGDRRAILGLVAAAPMYGKPHLSIWGDDFVRDRPDEGMGLRHQGIAASLLPSSGYACHNYAVQLAEALRREEAYRWADRATIAAPSFNNAHLDCVRRLRQVSRPGQAFAEAAYRCKDVLDRWAAGQIPPTEEPARHHAELLLALVHFDVGRLDEAVAIAGRAVAEIKDGDNGAETFGWARKRLAQWQQDPTTLAQSYAWEGHHRGDPGRVVAGFARGKVEEPDDAAMMLDALVAIGREDLALVAYDHFLGAGAVADGKARVRGARLHIQLGDLDRAIEDLLIATLRRGQSRLEAEINRTLRLAVVRTPDEWRGVLERLVEKGARRLARLAARDLADFVPDLDLALIERCLGARPRWEVDAAALAALAQALPALGASGAAIAARLDPPTLGPGDDPLTAADLLGQEWWTVLVPPNKDRDAHAAGALYALGIAVARYLALASGPATPIAGAYRHIATEALHLVRRARYQIDDAGARAILTVVETCKATPDWLLDPWVLRIERALDLDNEHGSHLAALVDGLPRVRGLCRGDERIGWELRLAWDLAADPSQAEPACALFERCQRALEAGGAAAAWSQLARGLAPAEALDVHWFAALANAGTKVEPWIDLGRALWAHNRHVAGFDAICRGLAAPGGDARKAALAALAPSWPAELGVPFGFDDAQTAGLAALAAGDLGRAARCMRWCEAYDPKNPVIKKNLAIVHARAGALHDAVRAAAGFDRIDPARAVGGALLEGQHHAAALLALRYAAVRFAGADDWRMLAVAAWYARDDGEVAHAYGKMLAANGHADATTLHAHASALVACGQWAEGDAIARRLLEATAEPALRAAGLDVLARALAGQGQFAEATAAATEALRINPVLEHRAAYAATVAQVSGGYPPAVVAAHEFSVERRAWDALAAGDMATPEALAIAGNSWGLFRAALAAAEFRAPADNASPVPPRALAAATMVLERSAGHRLPDAVMCRLRALRIRENAFIQIDPPPPVGNRLTPAEFDAEFARRAASAGTAAPSTEPIRGGGGAPGSAHGAPVRD
jgi:tetratricopeptide (TPR) repeat protein